MSYPGYTPPSQTPAGAVPQTATTYPYGAYATAYGHPTAAGAYSYPASAYQTGVTGYGWTYPYGYHIPQPHAQTAATSAAHVQRPAAPATPAVATQATTTCLPQRTASFSAYTPNYSRESLPSHTGGRGGRRQSNFKGLFTKELKNLMYGFGDDRNPSNDTVNVMEEILIEYITDVCQTAAGPAKKTRLSVDDLRRVLSHPADAKKLARLEELLFMQEDIKRARAQFEESDIHNPKGI
ncbi:unnamed protein product [Cyclocybe aegerita]|uniref:Transcription initiation factor TFIID subunit 13 n=1 Tax=Cyclocybe aegerita TaxID=1973307 RepID=A0A8S0VRP3_CYCAE|nr:unnamed protein product [Cyclocybe aegerita]